MKTPLTTQATCCPETNTCCYGFMQCSPAGSPKPCEMVHQNKPVNSTSWPPGFYDGFDLLPSTSPNSPLDPSSYVNFA